MAKEITDANFAETIGAGKPVVVDSALRGAVHAAW